MKTDIWGRFHHVGVVVDSRDTANRIVETFWLGSEAEEDPEGNTLLYWERVEEFSCWCAFLVWHPRIEFIVPDDGSILARFLGGKSSLHHVAFKVRDIGKLKWKPLFPKPVLGASGLLVNFFAPRHGLLVEVVQETENEDERQAIRAQVAYE